METFAHKLTALAPPATDRPSRRASRQKVNAILARRDRLMAELASLHQQGGSAFVDNAQRLLTRWWSGASWHGRDELIRNAEWLIRLEKCQQRGPRARELAHSR